MAAMSREQWLATYPQYTSADYDQQFGIRTAPAPVATQSTGGLLDGSAGQTTTQFSPTTTTQASPGQGMMLDISQRTDLQNGYDQSGNYTGGGTGSAQTYSGSGASLNLNGGTAYKRPSGIPAYNGYQPPNYGNTTPNSTHWLNTMNAYAPQGRTDMARLLGQGGAAGSSGGIGSAGGMGAAASAAYQSAGGSLQPAAAPYQKPGVPTTGGMSAGAWGSTGLLGGPTQPAATQPVTQPTNPFPTEWTQNSAPGYMDAFWNVPGSAYAPPGTQTQQQTAYSQPASTQQSSWSNGTVGINPATGSLTFL